MKKKIVKSLSVLFLCLAAVEAEALEKRAPTLTGYLVWVDYSTINARNFGGDTQATATEKEKAEIMQWIRQLASKEHSERYIAQNFLARFGNKALPYILYIEGPERPQSVYSLWRRRNTGEDKFLRRQAGA